jgi:hypoxanthine phosphoribosyltransferase
VPFAGQLMTQLTFPLDFDYVQVSRYGQASSGGTLSWRVEPTIALHGRTVLVVDDILDEGADAGGDSRPLAAAGRRRLLYGGGGRQAERQAQADSGRFCRADGS